MKVFGDGALGSFGAAMKEPYSDNPSERGILISDEASFQPLFKQVRFSLCIATHLYRSLTFNSISNHQWMDKVS